MFDQLLSILGLFLISSKLEMLWFSLSSAKSCFAILATISHREYKFNEIFELLCGAVVRVLHANWLLPMAVSIRNWRYWNIIYLFILSSRWQRKSAAVEGAKICQLVLWLRSWDWGGHTSRQGQQATSADAYVTQTRPVCRGFSQRESHLDFSRRLVSIYLLFHINRFSR